MELPERKMRILQAIIRTYLATGEPVGSRTISKYADLNLSAATIRNEMSDLEELGLIIQPHTSAGRIPSDVGYRLYVDEMLREKEKSQQEREEVLLAREDRLENLLKQVVKLLATNTNYASMISSPVISRNKIKFIQLSQVDAQHVLAVIVIEGNLIRNTMIPVDEEIDAQELLKLNMLLNGNLAGLAIEQINIGLIAAIKQQAGVHSQLIANVIDAAAKAIEADDRPEIYTSGADNIFRYPELADQSKASRIIGDFEEKQVLGNIVRETLADPDTEGIQVYIGGEVPARGQGMEDCSVVTATYELSEGMKGTIGIIGPKRMDYDKVVDVMKQIMTQLDDYYKQ
ncbi:MAG: heat-inducible transcriptional repressor HrcA [Lachnospiraceae bacterium]|nr:heat-inducible transcriptional repressor HrcA [Lachnospiraceae bacterium]MDD4526304.1 heat-inducible transcriptional repressor HrcA [Lachnospiraceae bacterium]